MNANDQVDVDRAAEILGVTTWTVYNWVRKGLLHPATSGGKLLFDKTAVVEFKDKQPRRGRPRGKSQPSAATDLREPVAETAAAPLRQDRPPASKQASVPDWMLPKRKPILNDEEDGDLIEEEL